MLDYPAAQLDLALVDNASTDGSTELVAREFPGVRMQRLDRNYGFCGAYNRAASAAPGELVVLLNNDTRAEPGWLRELAACWQRHQPARAVAATMLNWDLTGRFRISRLNFHGFWHAEAHGRQPGRAGVERVPFGLRRGHAAETPGLPTPAG
jgi:GT2 family glycosyltransferase